MNDQYWDKLAYREHDIKSCADEPIQFCGAIQAHGYLAFMDKASSNVDACSQNLSDLLRTPIESILGAPLTHFFRGQDGKPLDFSSILNYLQEGDFSLRTIHGQDVICQVHRTGSGICMDIELDPHISSDRLIKKTRSIQTFYSRSMHATELTDIVETAAHEFRKITRLERVMIYRFEPNWDGVVIAESKRDELDPYLNLRFPASDIPPQARALFSELKHRYIRDTGQVPIPVVSRPGHVRVAQLDLGASSLRAVSPFHIQYLQNMGVVTSLALPIRVEGKLWGLVACHGYEPHAEISRQLRISCELEGEILSGRIATFLAERKLKRQRNMLEFTQGFLDRVTDGSSPLSSFVSVSDELMRETNSTGLYVRVADEAIRFGDVPPDAVLEQILDLLHQKSDSVLFCSDDIHRDLGLNATPTMAGLMVAPLSPDLQDLVMWFRKPYVQAVKWAGNPTDSKASTDLNPRKSFGIWQENIKHRSEPWDDAAQEVANAILFSFVRGVFSKARKLAAANSELSRLTTAKDEFISTISHELRTPLGVIIGWIDILRDEIGGVPSAHQALETIERNAKLQVSLINDLLDLSRIMSGKLRISPEKDVSIIRVIEQVVEDLRPTAKLKNITINTTFKTEIQSEVDPERLRQVIWNLISNAIKFTPKGGVVEVGLRKADSSYQISVKDNGVGIDRYNLTRIFERFAQAGENSVRAGGLGLGLSIVKALAELHGGQVQAFSEGMGEGSEFVVTLPISALRGEARDADLPISSFKPSNELEGVRVLLAEDQEDAASALAYTLRKVGAKVVAVSDGRSALEAYKNASFDLILSDIGMPNMRGDELIKAIRRHELETLRERAPAIALTAYASVADRVNCLQAGFNSHLPKPFDKKELLAVIASLLPLARVPDEKKSAPVEMHFALLYRSRALQKPTVLQLSEILIKSQRNNGRARVTGLLLHSDTQFMQVLEGSERALEIIMQKIRANPMHADIEILNQGPIEARLFPSWEMGSQLEFQPVDLAKHLETLIGTPSAPGGELQVRIARQMRDFLENSSR